MIDTAAQLTFDELAVAEAYTHAAHAYVCNNLDDERVFLLRNVQAGEGIIIAPLQPARENWGLYNHHAAKAAIMEDNHAEERKRRAQARIGRVEQLAPRIRPEGMEPIHPTDTGAEADRQ